MLELEELFRTKKPKDIDKFADYILNKLKRDNGAIALDGGYIMSGYKCYMVNDNFYSRSETKEFIMEHCKAVL
jgi:hypothetical protein